MKLFGLVLLIGALIVAGLLCSFLVLLGLNKREVWKVLGELIYDKK